MEDDAILSLALRKLDPFVKKRVLFFGGGRTLLLAHGTATSRFLRLRTGQGARRAAPICPIAAYRMPTRVIRPGKRLAPPAAVEKCSSPLDRSTPRKPQKNDERLAAHPRASVPQIATVQHHAHTHAHFGIPRTQNSPNCYAQSKTGTHSACFAEKTGGGGFPLFAINEHEKSPS